MANGLLAKLYEQIDPLRLAEYDRTNRIAEQYGERIKSALVKPHAIKQLLEKYPSHEFCIDALEAKELFTTIDQPIKDLEELGNFMKAYAEQCLLKEETSVFYLTTPRRNENKPDESSKKQDIEPNTSVGTGGNGDKGKEKPEPAVTEARTKTAKLAARSKSGP